MSTWQVAPEGHYVAFLSTNVEGESEGMSAQDVARRELAAGLELLIPSSRIFYDVYDLMVPVADGTADQVRGASGACDPHHRIRTTASATAHGAIPVTAWQVFISESFDPTSHFETAISDVLAMYRRITGSDLVLQEGGE